MLDGGYLDRVTNKVIVDGGESMAASHHVLSNGRDGSDAQVGISVLCSRSIKAQN
jgi:hypothetical protein